MWVCLFFRTLVRTLLPLHRVPAFREVDKAECMGGSTCQLPASSLGLTQLAEKSKYFGTACEQISQSEQIESGGPIFV